jgi:hypothetical protein
MPKIAMKHVRATRRSAHSLRDLTTLAIAGLLAICCWTVIAPPAHAVTQGGTCNAFPGAVALGGAYSDSSLTVPACGPVPYPHGPTNTVKPYPTAPRTIEGYQCVEFSERFIYYKYGLGVPNLPTNGDQLVDRYAAAYPDKFDVMTAASKVPLAQGDVLSFSSVPTFNAANGGHTSVVQASSIDSNGNGSVTVVEENASAKGTRAFNVKQWAIQGSGNAYIKWLHRKGVPPTTTPGSGGSGGAKKLDVVFAIDTTGSMSPYINSVVAAASSIVSSLDAAHADYRVGLVDYKDSDYGCGNYDAVTDLAFSNSKSAILAALAGLQSKVSGGCDTPEDVYSGIHRALGFPWRNGVSKSVIFMGDAPGHDPEPHSGLTLNTIKAEAFAVDPAQLYAILIGTDSTAHAFHQALADATGGQSFDATSDPGAAGQAFVDAIDLILGTLQATATTVTPIVSAVPAGAPVALEAKVYPLPDSGGVTFLDGGTPILSCQGVAVDAQGTSTCTTTFASAGSHAISAVYSGSGTFEDSTSPAVLVSVTGDCVSGASRPLSVPRNGSLCIGPHAVVNGGVVVAQGASLYMYGATVHGAIAATSPARLMVCGSTVDGALGVTSATGLITVGDLDAATPCGGNAVGSGISLLNNRAGVQVSNNTVRGSLIVSGTTGRLPAPDTGSVDMKDNVRLR